jgi:hypothetical protein
MIKNKILDGLLPLACNTKLLGTNVEVDLPNKDNTDQLIKNTTSRIVEVPLSVVL